MQLTIAEKQIISCLARFRTRYALFLDLDLERPANKENIESFGHFWIGELRADWRGGFESMVAKGVLEWQQNGYGFTKKGSQIQQQVESETPFFKYEYDNFFHLEQKSQAHKQFCMEVYGNDLSQHGLIDQQELSLLIDKMKGEQYKKILDIGCGNGKITEHLSTQIPAQFTGIDISAEGINAANQRTQNKENLHFETGNMNGLKLKTTYDAILFLDTLYYAEDIESLLKSCLAALNPNGKIYAYFSNWIMDVEYANNLKPHNTGLAKVLQALGVTYEFEDLTESGLRHWKKKWTVLEKMEETFTKEGNEALWQYRYREANRYANWGDDKYTRYLYEISNNL